MAWPAVKRDFQQEAFRAYVDTLVWNRWRPSMIVLHNTAAPSLAQWHETAAKDQAAGRVPGASRIASLEQYFRNDQGWSGAPHLFVADDRIWVFNPLTLPGVHSPSWNGISIGIEMVADFAREDDDAGPGLKVRRNAEFCTAVLCATLGLDPQKAVKLHREDPKTTHDCPGKDFAQDEAQVIAEIADLMDGGDHDHAAVAAAIGVIPKPAPPAPQHGIVTTNDLNMRTGAGITNNSIGSLQKGADIIIIGKASNGATGWLRVAVDGAAGHREGWVAAKYVKIIA